MTKPTEESFDRRRVERVRLPEPLVGFVGDTKVEVQEVGLLGARIESSEPFERDAKVDFRFVWGPKSLGFVSKVAWVIVDQPKSEATGEPVYRMGLELVEGKDESSTQLRTMIMEVVSQALEEQKANARGETDHWSDTPFMKSATDESTRTGDEGKKSHFICCQLDEKGMWRRSTILKPYQPRVGFTVKGSISEDELDKLCKAYLAADEDGRHLIRLCAELSAISDEEPAPPIRYVP